MLPEVAVRLSCPRTRSTATRPTRSALKELETRWDYDDPAYRQRHREDVPHRSVASTRSSARRKVAADVMVQEYGRYFGMPTCCLRGGCLTGPQPFRRRAARVPELPGQVQPRRAAPTGSSATRASRCATTSIRYDVARFIEEFFGGAARRPRSTTSAAAVRTPARSSRRSRAVAADHREADVIRVRRQEPRRRSHLLHQRSAKMQAHYPKWRITKSLDDIFSEIATAWEVRA